MNPEKPGLEVDPRCWDCGAENDPGASECWLCERRDWRSKPGSQRTETVARAHRQSRPLSSISGLMILIALVAVMLGVWQVVPGLSVILFFALPAWGLTEVKAYRRRRGGGSMSGPEKLIWTVCLTILIPIVLMAALVAALFVICSSMQGASDFAGPFIVVGGFLVLFFGAFLFAVLHGSRSSGRKLNRR